MSRLTFGCNHVREHQNEKNYLCSTTNTKAFESICSSSQVRRIEKQSKVAAAWERERLRGGQRDAIVNVDFGAARLINGSLKPLKASCCDARGSQRFDQIQYQNLCVFESINTEFRANPCVFFILTVANSGTNNAFKQHLPRFASETWISIKSLYRPRLRPREQVQTQ